jgi:ArsR family transcriptional regulator, arsenate/arsenite/antimonite-responsive transcriptional repressor
MLRYYFIELREHIMNAATPTSKNANGHKSAGGTSRLSRARRTAILKALADPHRFHLVEQIAKAGCPLGCAQARSSLAISPATLSHHIKELEAAGVIEIERQGKFHLLSLRPGVLEALIGTFESLIQPSCKQS